MAKFNAKSKDASRTINYMGGKSFKLGSEQELLHAVLTTFLDSSYYESKKERMTRLKKLIKESDPIYVAKLAAVARNEFHMRSVSHLLLAELSKTHSSETLRLATVKSILRPDDIIEIAAYLKGEIPNNLERGLRRSLYKFNRYQLAKYQSTKHAIRLVDIFRLLHPNPKFASEEQKQAWADLKADKLTQFDTWENDIKQLPELILKGKVGYMALLRNLNNLIKYKVSEDVITKAIEKLTNPESVAKSKQLPFRFLSAYAALESKGSSELKFEKDSDLSARFRDAVEEALNIATQNIPLLPGKTIILSDNSGSMNGDGGGSSAVSAYSKRKTADIANLFATMYWQRAENTIVGLFGDTLILPKLDRKKGLFQNYKKVSKQGGEVGNSTETGIFDMYRKLIKDQVMTDRIIVFSDGQLGEGTKWYTSGGEGGSDFNKLHTQYLAINPACQTYVIDLKGYGDVVTKHNVTNLAGWSDKLFDFIAVMEKGESLVQYVKNYNLTDKQ